MYMYPHLLASPNPLPINLIPGGLQLYAEISAPKIVQETFPVVLKQKNPLKIHYYNERYHVKWYICGLLKDYKCDLWHRPDALHTASHS